MVDADLMTIVDVPDETAFRARLQRSGRLEDGWLDLAIDLEGASIERIQTFVPPGRPLSPGVFEIGIGLVKTPAARDTEGRSPPPTTRTRSWRRIRGTSTPCGISG